MIASFESPLDLLLLGLLALVVFGPKRLPEIGRSLGAGMREFRASIGGVTDTFSEVAETAAAAESTLPSPSETWLADGPQMPGGPPAMLESARVLQFVRLSAVQSTGRTRHIVNGVEVGRFDALALSRYDDEPDSIYLQYCDRDWNVITETRHDDVTGAIEHASFEFGPLQFEQT